MSSGVCWFASTVVVDAGELSLGGVVLLVVESEGLEAGVDACVLSVPETEGLEIDVDAGVLSAVETEGLGAAVAVTLDDGAITWPAAATVRTTVADPPSPESFTIIESVSEPL